MEIQSKKGMDLKVGYTGRRLALARSRFVVPWRENKRREVGYLAEKEKERRRRIQKKKGGEDNLPLRRTRAGVVDPHLVGGACLLSPQGIPLWSPIPDLTLQLISH
ncbi:unnamed protein product, partial [Ilex paraguariensis]